MYWYVSPACPATWALHPLHPSHYIAERCLYQLCRRALPIPTSHALPRAATLNPLPQVCLQGRKESPSSLKGRCGSGSPLRDLTPLLYLLHGIYKSRLSKRARWRFWFCTHLGAMNLCELTVLACIACRDLRMRLYLESAELA